MKKKKTEADELTAEKLIKLNEEWLNKENINEENVYNIYKTTLLWNNLNFSTNSRMKKN